MKKTYRICRVIRMLARKKRPRTAAIILAAGVGSRMQSRDGRTKQTMTVCGLPLVVHTVRAFDRCPYIDDIILVCRREERALLEAWMREYGIRKFRRSVVGGSTRQMSAIAGFEAIDGERVRFVAIHDAARCLITSDMIADVVSAAYAHRAASAATRVHDTVKRANGAGDVLGTVDRRDLWLAQTPQVFSADLYRAAAYTAAQAGFAATDDMMLCERIGQTVRLIDCGEENFKITTPTDLARAEFVLSRRGEEER